MASPTPRVMLIRLREIPGFFTVQEDLLRAMKGRAQLEIVNEKDFAIQTSIEYPQSKAVIVPLLIHEILPRQPYNSDFWDAVMAYIKRGGTAVILGSYSLHGWRHDMEGFFGEAGLDWTEGSSCMAKWRLNKDVVPARDAALLEKAVRFFAYPLKYVDEEDKWFKSNRNTRYCVKGEAAMALAKVGGGKLGYIGDRDILWPCTGNILALCGLLQLCAPNDSGQLPANNSMF